MKFTRQSLFDFVVVPTSDTRPEWQKAQDEEEQQKLNKPFDESSYLKGKVSLFGDTPMQQEWQPTGQC